SAHRRRRDPDDGRARFLGRRDSDARPHRVRGPADDRQSPRGRRRRLRRDLSQRLLDGSRVSQRISPVYSLILLQTLACIAIVPLVPALAGEFGLRGFESGMILSAASCAVLVVAFPLALLVDRLGARRVTIAAACIFTLATLGQGLANEFWTLLV